MREIKFRVFDRESFLMHYDPYFTFPTNLRLSEAMIDIGKHFWEWMQYTGLKDRSGKEIYEGDIVGIWIGMNNSHDVIELGNNKIVEWDDKDCRFNVFFGEDYIVIGNIYENPGLLENK